MSKFLALILTLIFLTSCAVAPEDLGLDGSVDDGAITPEPPIDAPTSVSRISPATSPNFAVNPQFQVDGVSPGHTIRIYSDSSCTNLRGSAVASGTSINITVSPDLSVSTTYQFYANASFGSVTSLCSTSFGSYQLDSSLGPSVTGLSNDTGPVNSKSWTWGCDKAACDYRFAVNTSSSHTFTVEPYNATSSTVHASGNGTYYIHVQAIDNGTLIEGVVQSYSVVMDTTAPSITPISITSNNANSVYAKVGDIVTLTYSVNEAITSNAVTIDGNVVTPTDLGSNNYSATYTMQAGDTEGALSFNISVQDSATNSNAATATTDASSVTFDETAPSVIATVDVTADDAIYNQATDATWAASSDLGSGLSHYEMKIGTTSGGNELFSFKNIGNVTSYQAGSPTDFAGNLTLGQSYYTSVKVVDNAGNESAETVSAQWFFQGPSDISNLSVASTLKDSADISWSISNSSVSSVTDYTINYRVKGSGSWLNFDDGVSTDIPVTVTGLAADTTYEFRVQFTFTGGLTSGWSNTAEGDTKPDDPIFDNPYKAMNVGGATDTTVVAYEDNTTINLNSAFLVNLNAGQTHRFTSATFDIIDADKPIYTAGRKGSGGDTTKGNIVWNPVTWAGKSFSFNSTRRNPQVVRVYAVEASTVEVYQGSTLLDSAVITAGGNGTLTWSVYGSYQLISTGTILAYHIAEGSSGIADPKPLLPGHTEIIGVPSRSMRITADEDSTNYTLYHSNSSTTSGSLNKNNVVSVSAQGTLSQFREFSLLISADKKISGASFADSNGFCAAPFLPTNLMKKKYVINVSADWVAFASKEAGTIDVLDSNDNVIDTLTLTRSGGDPNAPYKARRATTGAGLRFQATVPVGAWYQPNTDTGAARNDETILHGHN